MSLPLAVDALRRQPGGSAHEEHMLQLRESGAWQHCLDRVELNIVAARPAMFTTSNDVHMRAIRLPINTNLSRDCCAYQAHCPIQCPLKTHGHSDKQQNRRVNLHRVNAQSRSALMHGCLCLGLL